MLSLNFFIPPSCITVKVYFISLWLDTLEFPVMHLCLPVQVFHLPSEQAAIALGVTHSRVKRACRKLNLDRWPQRKLASLSLLQGVVEKDEQMPEDDQRVSTALFVLHLCLSHLSRRLDVERKLNSTRVAFCATSLLMPSVYLLIF